MSNPPPGVYQELPGANVTITAKDFYSYKDSFGHGYQCCLYETDVAGNLNPDGDNPITVTMNSNGTVDFVYRVVMYPENCN